MKLRLAAISLYLAMQLGAQDAAAVLNRYVQVTGGAELYKRYNSLHLFYTLTNSDKSTQNVDYFHLRDGRTLIDTDLGNSTRQAGVSEGVAWKYSADKGAQILSGKQAARFLAETKGFDEDDWHLRYTAVAALPNQTINNVACQHLKLTRSDGSVVERFYQVKSGLLVRQVSSEFDDAGVEQPTTTDFTRYDTFFGIQRPVSWRVKAGDREQTVEMNTVTYTVNPEAAVAELPHDVLRAIVASRAKAGGLPNAVDLIDKFVAATGGSDKYGNIKSEIVKAEVSFVGENLKFPVVTYSAGNKHYSVSEIPSLGKFESGDDGFTGWEKSLVMGVKLRPHSAASEFTGPEPGQVMNWSAGALNMETVSQDQVNGAACYVVRLSSQSAAAGDDAATACFDVKTGLLLRTSQKDKEGPAEQLYSDYRPVNGLMVAYHIDTKVAGHTASVQIQDVAVNGPVPAGIFDLPADVRALKLKRDNTPPAVSPGAPALKRPQSPQ